MTPPNDWFRTRWTDLGPKFIMTAAAGEMASGALHDPGVLGDVLKTNGTLRVWDFLFLF